MLLGNVSALDLCRAKKPHYNVKVTADLSLDAAGLPEPTINLDAVFFDLARGEVLSKYCDCGMRLQRTNPSVWNNFSKLLWAELLGKLDPAD